MRKRAEQADGTFDTSKQALYRTCKEFHLSFL